MIGEDEFYFTNFYHYHIITELHLGLHWGSVGYHDGTDARIVASQLFCPDGIDISEDGR